MWEYIWSNGHSLRKFSSPVLYSRSSTLVHMQWLGVVSVKTPPSSESLMQTISDITSSPSAQFLPWHHSSASSRLQFLAPVLGSQRLTFSCLDFPPPPAEIWFSDFIALSLMLTTPTLLAFLFPFSGKISFLMNPVIYIQSPGAATSQESHMRANWL